MTKFIYFMRRHDSAIKIGISRCPFDRAASLQAEGYGCLRVLGMAEGDAIDEKHAQDLCAEHHIRGEWFHPHSDIISLAEKCDGQSARQLLLDCLPQFVLKRNGKSGHRCIAASPIYHFRLKHHLSRADFAKGIGALPWTVDRWECGDFVGIRFALEIERFTAGSIRLGDLRSDICGAAA